MLVDSAKITRMTQRQQVEFITVAAQNDAVLTYAET